MDSHAITRKQAATKFNRSVSTIRTWQKRYSQWMNIKPGEFSGGVNQPVVYDDHDQQVLSIIDQGLRQKMTHKEILAGMDDALAVAATEPILPEDDQKAGQPAPEDGVLMTEREARISTAYAQLQGKIEAIENENEYLRQRNEELEAQLLTEVKRTWLQRLLGRK